MSGVPHVEVVYRLHMRQEHCSAEHLHLQHANSVYYAFAMAHCCAQNQVPKHSKKMISFAIYQLGYEPRPSAKLPQV